MKKIFKSLLALTMVFMLGLSVVACASPEVEDPGGDTEGDNRPVEQIDPNKTQLYINNFEGGYGSDWLAAVKARFEEAHKDDEQWEPGKKGVQIYVNSKKVSAGSLASQILDNRDEIYFSEYSYYRTMKSENVLADITDAVTGDLQPYGDKDGSTIEKKLTEQQREFYGIEENGEVHYYALPHYAGYFGIVYNVDLFEEKGYYFVEGYKNQTGDSRRFRGTRQNKNKPKSVGLDGKPNTDDDGLPTTYEEFKELAAYINAGGDTAISWNGTYSADYLGHLLEALYADYEGADQMLLNYNFGSSGIKANDLGTIKNGRFVRDENPTSLTPETNYETARQQGRYEALKFIDWLVEPNNDKYHNSLAFNGAYSHMNAQEDFLYAGHDGGVTAPIAMMVEGIWWENEANATFNKMAAQYGDEYSRMSRKFAFMPLPKADETKAAAAAQSGKSMTLIDHLYSICFLKANIAEWKKPLALDFLKFVHSDQSLVEYTTITNSPKAFEYDMTDEQLAKLSPFGRSVMNLRKNSEVIYPFSSQPKYVRNQSSFVMYDMYSISSTRKHPSVEMRENGVTPEQYFTLMSEYYKTFWTGK